MPAILKRITKENWYGELRKIPSPQEQFSIGQEVFPAGGYAEPRSFLYIIKAVLNLVCWTCARSLSFSLRTFETLPIGWRNRVGVLSQDMCKDTAMLLIAVPRQPARPSAEPGPWCLSWGMGAGGQVHVWAKCPLTAVPWLFWHLPAWAFFRGILKADVRISVSKKGAIFLHYFMQFYSYTHWARMLLQWSLF